MTAKSVLTTGDLVKFDSIDGAVLLGTPQFSLKGSSRASINSKEICVKGDGQQSSDFTLCPYNAPPFVTPGTLKCTIKALDSSNLSKIAHCDKKQVLYVGSQQFIANYEVIFKAIDPTTGNQDMKSSYSGKGSFNKIQLDVVKEN